jgi:rhamnose transport system substrate-binding protein
VTNAAVNYEPSLASSRRPLRLNIQQLVLAAFLLLEVLVFSVIAHNFLSAENLFQVPRLNVELGLIALALTPVIVTGGIDLSVGSLLGLCAVLFGKLWRDAGLDPWLAATLTIALGGLASLLNAALITTLRIPPLIVTLGSMSLFRGIAEGLTGGVDNFTRFPPSFLHLGQGYFHLGKLLIPVQIPIFIAMAILFWALLHRTTIGRAWSAIGYSPEGARHAGIPVERCVALAYVLSGLAAGLAAVVYVARVGQAKADAGTGYELAAVTAVVLGGTSIFGGRGSIVGTLMGLFAVAILQNGLRLADEPAEATGVLTGLLLLAAIGLDRFLNIAKTAPAIQASPTSDEELSMKNSQLAVLCTVIVAAALIVAMSNYQLSKTIIGANRSTTPSGNAGGPAPSGRKVTIAMMPKSKGNAYFIAAQKGANDAAAELGVNLIWDGPTDPDPAKQNEIVDTWVTRGVDAIAVACEKTHNPTPAPSSSTRPPPRASATP